MSTRYTFHNAGHSSRQFSLPFSIEEEPEWPHRSHRYFAVVPSIEIVFAPIVWHSSQKASKGIHPEGYGWRARYLFTRTRTSSLRAARSRTRACISGFLYASVVVTIRTPGANRSRTLPKSLQ